MLAEGEDSQRFLWLASGNGEADRASQPHERMAWIKRAEPRAHSGRIDGPVLLSGFRCWQVFCRRHGKHACRVEAEDRGGVRRYATIHQFGVAKLCSEERAEIHLRW